MVLSASPKCKQVNMRAYTTLFVDQFPPKFICHTNLLRKFNRQFGVTAQWFYGSDGHPGLKWRSNFST
jgi:hypothetical protein